MANKRIQDLPIVPSIDGSEEMPINKGGITNKATTSQIKTYLGITLESKDNKESVSISNDVNKYPSSKAVLNAFSDLKGGSTKSLSQIESDYDSKIGKISKRCVDFITDNATTRLQINNTDRTRNFMLSYNIKTEQYIGSTFSDAEWVKDSNWVNFEMFSNKNIANGYAGLDANGQIKLSVVPIVPIPNYLSFRKLGDGTGIVAFDLTSQITGNVEVTNGFLCDGANGANPTIIKPIIKNNQTTFYLKCTKNNCIVKCYNIVLASSSTTNINAPSLYFSPANLPAGLTYLEWGGQNTGTGDIANLPAGLTSLGWYGRNTGTGDIANLPAGLTYLEWGGQNTGTGDIANLPAGLTYLGCGGQNTGTGDIANLPAGLTVLSWYGQNTGTGDIANLPAGLTILAWGGQNTGTGNVANLPAGLTYLEWGGQNTGTFSGDKIWAQNMRSVSIAPKSAGIFTSAMTDNLLISLSKQSVWTGEKAIDIRGNCGARTSASDSAVTLLRSYGVTVLTN